MKLEDMVEQLAKDQVSLESQAKNSLKSVKKGAEIGIYLDYSLIISSLGGPGVNHDLLYSRRTRCKP
jgi:hypothetical protein